MKINSSSRNTYDVILEKFGPLNPSQSIYDELLDCCHIMTSPAFVFYSPMSDMLSIVQHRQAPKVELDLSLIVAHPDTKPCDLANYCMIPWLPAPHLEPGPMMFLYEGWIFHWTSNQYTAQWGLKAIAKH